MLKLAKLEEAGMIGGEDVEKLQSALRALSPIAKMMKKPDKGQKGYAHRFGAKAGGKGKSKSPHGPGRKPNIVEEYIGWMDNHSNFSWGSIKEPKYRIFAMVPPALLQSPRWVWLHVQELRAEEFLHSSGKTEPGSVPYNQASPSLLCTIARVAYCFFAGVGFTPCRRSDLQSFRSGTAQICCGS